jgi:hypothetical protein
MSSTLNPSFNYNAGSTTSGLNNLNLLQPTGFKISIDRRYYTNLEYFCQSVIHPSLAMNAAEIPIRRISSLPLAGDKLTFSELTCMIIVDEELNSYTEMYNWMQRIVETNEVSPEDARRTGGVPTYADITLSILSSHNNTTRKIRYIDCMPTMLGDLSLETTTGDTGQVVFPASFRFREFVME